MKKLPTSIRIGTQIWEVSEQKRKHTISDDHYGFTNTSANTIVLDAEMAPSKRRAVLLHEVLHAIHATFGGSFEPTKTTSFNDWEHYFIGLYEEPLIMVLRDNPELVGFLLND